MPITICSEILIFGMVGVEGFEGPSVGSVEVEEDADEEEEEEGDGVEEEDVGDVGDVGGGEEGHLFFGGAHEEEAGCVEELKVKVLVGSVGWGMGNGQLTKGVRYWKLLVSSASVSEMEFWSFSTKAISTILTAPAAMSVYPNTVWTWVLSSRSCGWALIPHPVSMMTTAGKRFLFGLPSLFRDSHTPSRPAHHQTIPMLVCCRSFFTHGPPHLCSVKVLTQPQAAISKLSKNS